MSIYDEHLRFTYDDNKQNQRAPDDHEHNGKNSNNFFDPFVVHANTINAIAMKKYIEGNTAKV